MKKLRRKDRDLESLVFFELGPLAIERHHARMINTAGDSFAVVRILRESVRTHIERRQQEKLTPVLLDALAAVSGKDPASLSWDRLLITILPRDRLPEMWAAVESKTGLFLPELSKPFLPWGSPSVPRGIRSVADLARKVADPELLTEYAPMPPVTCGTLRNFLAVRRAIQVTYPDPGVIRPDTELLRYASDEFSWQTLACDLFTSLETPRYKSRRSWGWWTVIALIVIGLLVLMAQVFPGTVVCMLLPLVIFLLAFRCPGDPSRGPFAKEVPALETVADLVARLNTEGPTPQRIWKRLQQVLAQAMKCKPEDITPNTTLFEE